MSLFNKFSLSHNMNKAQKKESNEDPQDSMQVAMVQKNVQQPKPVLEEHVVETLLQFNYSLEQIVTAYRIYKFSTVDEAVSIMMKDSETGKYNHQFLPLAASSNISVHNNMEYRQAAGMESQNNLKCQICGDTADEHLDYSIVEETKANRK